ncbi:TIGR02147 family protein [Peredibacter starrii]|uniref:TIGR02147 family protein n=1 Tax=Peredibacter starrii TaxID=28202 RepID=A0AAX4HVG9_9BACT|nr:TIGR02147 family protein [Peredibacter starrii]WPU67083.1 TIGR02147 family protein [Peredibacter starrii]
MQKNFAAYLEKEFLERRNRNPSYSLRAFAKLLGVDQSTLSKFFNGARDLSWTIRTQCLERLGASETVIAQFEEERRTLLSEYTELEESLMTVIGDWRFWGVLEYLKIDNKCSVEFLANRFHIPVEDMQGILEQLLKLGFISQDQNVYKLLKPNNSWVDGSKTSEARKMLQKRLSQLSYDAIDKVGIESRYHGSLTVAVDKNRLPEIKDKIMAFQAELGQYIQKKSSLNEVYQLTVSFFPLTKGSEV